MRREKNDNIRVKSTKQSTGLFLKPLTLSGFEVPPFLHNCCEATHRLCKAQHCLPKATPFCVRFANNDVLAMLEKMFATMLQNDVVSCAHKHKEQVCRLALSFAKDYLNGAELGEKLPKSNVPVLLDKLEFTELFLS